MSLVLRQAPPLLPLASAVAVCDAIRETSGVEARIKWPNDIVLEQKRTDAERGAALAKLAGILVEGRPHEDWVVLGIGVNVAISPPAVPAELRGMVATLGQERSAIEPLLERLLQAFERRLSEPESLTLADWRVRDALEGRLVRWIRADHPSDGAAAAGEGRARGIDGDGRLVVERRDGGRVTVDSGEVHLLSRES
jgi:BirA family biotin operon repressor/biotin-[acetyl-CoA-carboxylase] ligase